MRSSGDNAAALLQSVGLHLALLAILVVGVQTRSESRYVATNIIEATIVDESTLSGGIERIDIPEPEQPEEPEIDENAERERLEELERQRREEEQRRETERAEQARQAAEEEQARAQAALEQRQREAEQAERQAAEEARLKAEAEAKRKAEEEARLEAEAEARRKAEEEARLKAEAEAKRKAEEQARLQAEAEAKRKAEEEARRKAAEEEARRRGQAEADLQALLAAEEQRRSAVDAGLLAVYKAKIKQKIERYWRPPPVSKGDRCELRARQLRTGDLAVIDSIDCGGNAPLERSLEAAVNQASPFPLPDDPSLFEPNLRLIFEPDIE